MRTQLATYALAGTLGLTGIAGVALLAPAASYAATGDSTALTERVSRIGSALTGLVTDGTLTQAQADKVASTLAQARPARRGGPGGRVALSTAAEALGLTPAQLRTKIQAGKTLGEIAAEQGVENSTLVQALVTTAQERLDKAVVEGRLTQAQADERAATMTERITAQLDKVLPPGGHGHRGRGQGQGPDHSR